MEIQYKHNSTCVGNNLITIQITTKYRYAMMKQEKLKIFCKVAVEEACQKHKIELVIMKVLDEHVHAIVDCPRTLSIAKLMQLLKGLSSYLLFRICPELRQDVLEEAFGVEDIFMQVGKDFERVLLHHSY